MSTEVLTMICVVAAITAILLSGTALVLAFLSWSTVVGFKNSTHQVQFVPMTNEEGKELSGEVLDESMKKAMSQEFNIEREYL